MYYIGVDLGGTNVAIGIVNEKGEILKKGSVPTPKNGSEAVIEAISSLSDKLIRDMSLSKEDISGIGILRTDSPWSMFETKTGVYDSG